MSLEAFELWGEDFQTTKLVAKALDFEGQTCCCAWHRNRLTIPRSQKNDPKKRQTKMVTRIPETWKRTTSFLRLMASNYQAKTSHQKGEIWWNRKPAKCKGQRSWFPSKVPFRAQKVLVIFQASQKLAKTNISSVIRHQRNSNNLLLMSLCRTQHPKAALERTVFEEAANCAVTPPRGEGWTPRSSLYKLRVSFTGFCWSVQIVPLFHSDTLRVPCKLILHDC